ncbi:MAG: hypothetical protein OEY44_00780 [Candidatus Peregrinibacteria bacterium]|nr:hypothetical protein [Candidatus Peregrinibacteria bacterium]
MQIKPELLRLILAISLILAIGLFAGYSIGYFQARKGSFPAITEAAEQNPGICTVKFLKTTGGLLKGRVDGTAARLAYGPDQILSLSPGDSFEIPIYQVTLANYYAAKNLPDDTQFIASSSGKYYYHVFDPRALRITPKNRVYFSSEESAKSAGFQAPK